MAKKMTGKEFKEVLAMAGLSLDYEEILNQLSQNNYRMAQQCEEMGCPSAALKCREAADVLSEELNERGYFKDLSILEDFLVSKVKEGGIN